MPHHTWSVQINSRKRVPMQQESNSINSINRSNQPHPKHIKTSKTHTQLLPHHVHGQNNTAHVTFLFAVHFQQPLLAINQPRRSGTGGLAPSSFVALVGEFRNGRRRGLKPPAHAREKITDPHHGFHGHPHDAFADAFDKTLHPLFLRPLHRLREHPGEPGHNAFPQTFGPVPERGGFKTQGRNNRQYCRYCRYCRYCCIVGIVVLSVLSVLLYCRIVVLPYCRGVVGQK